MLLLSHRQIFIWAKRLKRFGIEGLRDKPKPGRKFKIQPEQLVHLKRIVLDSSPEDVFLFEGECRMNNTAHISYQWSEKGKQPLVEQKQYQRKRVTLLGCVNPNSGEVIVQKTERGNAKSFKKYLKNNGSLIM